MSMDEFSWCSGLGEESAGEVVMRLERSFEHAGYSAVESDYEEPRMYKEMLKRPELERDKWMEGMRKEFRDFESRKVWRKMKIKDLPGGRKLIGCKWVYKLRGMECTESDWLLWVIYRFQVWILLIIFTCCPGCYFKSCISNVDCLRT